MSAHRYWRILMYYAQSGGDGTLGISEIEMRETNGGSNAIGSGTAAASSSLNSSFLPAKAVDGNTATMWISTNNSADAWWSYDFGSGVTKDIVEVKLSNRTDSFYGEVSKKFDIQFSDDNSAWTTYWSRDYSPGYKSGSFWSAAAQSKVFAMTSRWWRIKLYYASTALADGVNSFAAIEMRSAIAGADLITGGFPVASSFLSNATSFEADKGHDGSVSTFWLSTNNSADAWWGYDFGPGAWFNVEEIVLTARNDGFYGETATHFDIDYSTDGTNWTTYWSKTGLAAWTTGLARTMNNPAPPGLAQAMFFGHH